MAAPQRTRHRPQLLPGLAGWWKLRVNLCRAAGEEGTKIWDMNLHHLWIVYG